MTLHETNPGAASRRRPDADLVIGLDCSTTAAKALVWNANGACVSAGQAGLELSRPAPGGFEQDPEEWLRASAAALRSATTSVDPARLRALCVAHQRETVVPVDDAARALRPALVWMDSRCAPQVDELRHAAQRLHQLSGKPWCTTPSLAKLLWLRAHEPEALDAAARIVEVHGLLMRRWTGRWVTSLASADPTGLVDLRRGDWSDELLAHAGLRRGQMPTLCAPGTVIGPLLPDAARACGLPTALPVVAGAGDGQAAGLGAGLLSAERAYLNLGTAIVSGVCSPDYTTDRAFRTLAGAAPGTYLLETDLKGGTFTLDWLVRRWLRSREGTGATAAELLAGLESAAAGLPPGAEGLLLLPYWCGVMNPYWDDDASGAVLGWRDHHGPAHMYRAILEGVAFEQRLHTEGVEQATGRPIEGFVVMGGGARSDLWCQIVADVTGRPVQRSFTSEATALGAGVLAAWGSALHPSLPAAVAAMTSDGRRFLPGAAEAHYSALYHDVYRELYPSVGPLLRRLSALRG